MRVAVAGGEYWQAREGVLLDVGGVQRADCVREVGRVDSGRQEPSDVHERRVDVGEREAGIGEAAACRAGHVELAGALVIGAGREHERIVVERIVVIVIIIVVRLEARPCV